MKKILIPTDFSENAWNALTFALALFANEKCDFLLFHVNPIVYSGAENSVIVPQHMLKESVIKESQKKLTSLLGRIEKKFCNKNHNFKSLAVYDFFIDAIKLQLAESEVDLIVMGTKGATGLRKVTLGSNTGHVITKIKYPLLAVPENAQFNGLKQILFPTDYHTGIDINVLDDLKSIMSLNNSNLKIVHMVSKESKLSRGYRFYVRGGHTNPYRNGTNRHDCNGGKKPKFHSKNIVQAFGGANQLPDKYPISRASRIVTV